MVTDFVETLGPAFLAHRLKRASELILETSAEVMRRNSVPRIAGSGSTLLLVAEYPAISITEIAFRLKLSHPFIVRNCDALEKADLIESRQDPNDQRRRLISLTSAGEAEVRTLQRYSRALEMVFNGIAQETGFDLYRAVEAFERATATNPLFARVTLALASTEKEMSA